MARFVAGHDVRPAEMMPAAAADDAPALGPWSALEHLVLRAGPRPGAGRLRLARPELETAVAHAVAEKRKPVELRPGVEHRRQAADLHLGGEVVGGLFFAVSFISSVDVMQNCEGGSSKDTFLF